MGENFGAGLTSREISWMRDHEWARHADDVLWRRSKLGLHYTPTEREAVARWCDAQWGAADGAVAAVPGSA
jgi:glycerol-3-phosphate dehydrogenase